MDPKALSDVKPDQLMAAMQILAQQNPQYAAAFQAAKAAQAQAQAAASTSAAPVAAASTTSSSVNPPTAVLPQYSVPAPPHGGSKYNHLLMIIEEINKDIRPTYSGNRNCAERLKRGINHAKSLARECLMELDKQNRT